MHEQRNRVVVDNAKNIQQELRREADAKIVAVSLGDDLVIHASGLSVDAHSDIILENFDNYRLLLRLLHKETCAVDGIDQFAAVYGNLRVALRVDHGVDDEVFAVDQAGMNDRVFKLENDIAVIEADADILVHLAGEDFPDLTESLAGNDDIVLVIGAAKLNVADADAETVEGGDAETIAVNLKILTGHHAGGLIGRHREDRLADQLLERELRDHHRISVVIREGLRELLTGETAKREFSLAANDGNCEGIIRGDHNIVRRQLAHQVGKHARVKSNPADLVHGCRNHGFNTKIIVVGSDPDGVVLRLYENALEDRIRSLRGDSFQYNVESTDQLCLAADNFHKRTVLSFDTIPSEEPKAV